MTTVQGAAISRRGGAPNWLLAGALAAFVGATFYRTVNRVSTDDLEKELDREIKQEERRQQQHAKAEGASSSGGGGR
jgi:predicted metal-dependent hydrolase